MTFKLGKHDKVVTAYAERASGPGWANSPIWVIIRSNLDGTYRRVCIQPADFIPEFVYLYDVSAAAHKAMTEAASTYLEAVNSKARLKRPTADTRPADSREGGLTHKGGHS